MKIIIIRERDIRSDTWLVCFLIREHITCACVVPVPNPAAERKLSLESCRFSPRERCTEQESFRGARDGHG